MSEPVSRSVHQTVHNLLTLLAQQGDPKAIEALKNSNELDIVDDIEGEDDDVRIVVMQSDGEYLVTQHGTSFVPKEEEKE
ncbi:hypothetical protein [Microseira sp. BLCC-F43]|jgi:hypothetical protein|uniref:hypothetical protein n=1 Tax=Microseira sp. BLCC-F43 TaxID=3153602 RepID=UPI0035B97750